MVLFIFIFIVLSGLAAFLGFNIGLENGKKIGLENGKKEGYSLGEKAVSQVNTKELNERYARGYVDSYVFNGIGAFDDVKSGFYVIKISELDKEPMVGLFGNVKIKDTTAGTTIKQPFYKITNLLNMGTGVNYFIKNNEIWQRDN